MQKKDNSTLEVQVIVVAEVPWVAASSKGVGGRTGYEQVLAHSQTGYEQAPATGAETHFDVLGSFWRVQRFETQCGVGAGPSEGA